MKVKKIPMRMCLGCQEMKPKRELTRVVKTQENVMDIDPTGKRSGRGAYICPNEECLGKAVKAKRLEKAFRLPVPQEVLQRLKEQLVSYNVQKGL